MFLATNIIAQDLVSEQLRYERVRQASADYDDQWRAVYEEQGFTYPPNDIYLRAFKFDKQLELWTKETDGYVLVKTFEICSLSGELGPKNRQGDSQIPEGFYQLESFNPVSSFHLSMRVNYPNAADRVRGYTPDLGGDIYIHGDCVTIGCIPIENEPIKELYWLSVLAKQSGGDLPIHIFPFRMDTSSIDFFERLPVFQKEDWNFWNQLLPGFDYFEMHHEIPEISITEDGRYVLSKEKNVVNN